MNKKFLLSIYCVSIFFFISCKENNKKTIFNSDNIFAEYYINNSGKKFWGVDPKIELDVLHVECENPSNVVTFKSKIDTIQFQVKEGDTINFKIVLHKKDTAMTQIVGIPKVIKNRNPLKAEIHTEDVKRFWKAYDMVQKNPEKSYQLYANEYIKGGTEGWKDYFRMKVRDTTKFVDHHNERPKFYASIKETMLNIDDVKPSMYKSFQKMKELYSKSIFPDVYFVMGRFSSAGTVSNKGLLIGLNQICRTESSITDELTLWQKNNFLDYESLPHVIAHELIHYQQFNMPADSTTLRTTIVEGMADFIGEKISGKRPSERVAKWAKGKENDIRERFIKDMLLAKSNNWIANSDQETKDFPADQGYWVGYEICKAYYDQSNDKSKAIVEILEIQDYEAFLKKSGWMHKKYPEGN